MTGEPMINSDGGSGVKLAVMQPYFLPYIGYFQLIAAVDRFIVYDNIKYTKKGWINRNRLLQDGKAVMFTLPIRRGSDLLDVCEREVAADFDRDRLLNQFKGAYRRAPHFARIFPLLERIVRYQDDNLFRYVHHSILRIVEHLGIATEISISSDIAIDHSLRSQEKVLALCGAVKATGYVNSIGGVELYSKKLFREKGVDLSFIKSNSFEYRQFEDAFVPWLSIVDVMMFNPLGAIKACISTNYEFI